MFPVLFSIGPLTISSLGFFIALAFFFGSFSFWKRAKEEHYEDKDIFDFVFLCFFAGIISSRLVYILLNFPQFGFDLNKWLNLAFSNQFSWLGFLLGGIYMLKIVAKKKKMEDFLIADFAVFGVIIAQIFVRIGQFLDGSFVGGLTDLPWGLVVPGLEGKRHPIAIYEIIFLLATLLLIRWFEKQYRLFSWYQDNRGEAKPGFLWLSYLSIFALIQFCLDFFWVRTPILWVFTLNQIVLLIFLILTLISFYIRTGRKMNISQNRVLLGNQSTKQDLEPIRPSASPLQSRPRFQRFFRAKKGQDVK